MIRLASLLAVICALWAASAHAQNSDDADLVARVDQLQAQIRELTGTVEQLQHRNQLLEQQLQQFQAGSPGATAAVAPARTGTPYVQPQGQYSPPGPSYTPPSQSQYPPAQYTPPPPAQYPASTAPQYPPLNPQYSPPPAPVIATAPGPGDQAPAPGRRSDAFDPTLNPGAPGAPRALGTSTAATEPPPPVADNSAPGPRQPGAPLDLSTVSAPSGEAAGGLPPPPAANPSGTGAMQAALPPGNTPKDEYDLAYGYVLHKDYGLAEDTFRDFLHKYPSDRLAPEAQYWLGESLFQDKQYRDAAESFLAVSTKYDTTARAPDALLRLGQSLAALGEKEAACASLGEVLRKYPRASAGVKQTVDREQKRVHC